MAWFRGLEDAQALRDRIRDRVNRYRSAGLGDTDDIEVHALSTGPFGARELAAAVRLREEARALARSLQT